MKPYDDGEYLRWVVRLNDLVSEYLDTEGNTVESLREEFDTAVDNAKPDAEPHVGGPKKP